MDHNSISHEEPGCSHEPDTKMKNTVKENNKTESGPKQTVKCVLRPQAEINISKQIDVHVVENHTDVGTLKCNDQITKSSSEERIQLYNNESNTSKEIAVHEPHTESITMIKPNENIEASVKIGLPPRLPENSLKIETRQHSHLPLLLISRPPSFIVDNKPADVITTQPEQQPMSPTYPKTHQPRTPGPNTDALNAAIPPSLFIQALSKVNQSNLSVTLVSQLQDIVKNSNDARNILLTQPEISAPSSITESAPPSYSFVLRQNSRRPQLMGTFIPSPSFVPLTPPPNYAAAFDIYVDNGVPPPRPRTINYGFTPMPVVCPICGVAGISVTHSKITLCTHLCAVLMCLFCCWLCVPLPYLLNSCKDVYHYCGNCRNFLGMYCPTNPDPTSSFA